MILQEIFEIISKMNPKEKSYFLRFTKLYSSNVKDRNYLILYNKINDQIKKNAFDIKTISEGISPNKFYNYKQHLHKILLKSLTSYHLPKEKKLVYEIHTIKWLMRKGIVSTAIRLLKKLKKVSIKDEAFETLFSIYILEMSMLQYKDIEFQLSIIQKDIKLVIDQYNIYSQYIVLFKQVMNLRREEAFLPTRHKKLAYYYAHSLLQEEKTANSKKSKFLFFSIRSILAYIERDYYKSFINNKKLVEILQEDNYKNVSSFDILHNMMLTCIHTKNKEAFWEYHKHLTILCEQSKNEYTHNLLKKITLRYYRVLRDYEKGLDLISMSKILDKSPEKLTEVESFLVIEMCFFCVLAKKYKKAVFFLNHWDASIGPKITSKYKFVVRILEILIHIELSNYLLAQSLTESLVQSFRLKKMYHSFEKIIISYCRNTLKNLLQITQLKLILRDTIDSISTLNVTQENIFWFEYFDFQFFFVQKLEEIE